MKDSKRIAMEMKADYAPEGMLDKAFISDQLRLAADEDTAMKDRIFEIGVREIAKQCRKQVLERASVTFDSDDIPYSKASLEEIKCLKNSELKLIYDIKLENGKQAICFVYCRKSGKYINLMVEADGSLYLSEEY